MHAGDRAACLYGPAHRVDVPPGPRLLPEARQFFRRAAEDSLADYARHLFGLRRRSGPLNLTIGEQLVSQAARGDPVAIAQLRAPAIPKRFGYLLDLYAEFGEFRHVGDYGEQPCDWVQLKAFCDMTGHTLTPWERSVFRRLDNAYFAAKVTTVAKGKKASEGAT